MISYEDFQKIEVRVGTIISAEHIEGTDKLIKLKVDFGEEEHRQIVSGILKFFPEPEDLVGKQTTFVVNLEPRTICGEESNGMLFAVGGDDLTLLTPEKEINPGSKAG